MYKIVMRNNPWIISAILAMISATGCGGADYSQPLTPVRVETLSESRDIGGLRYTATVNPYSQVNIDFKVDGYVREILQVEGADGNPRDIQEGDFVTKGLPLALVDPTEYLAKVVEAKSRLAEARASLQQDTEQYNRAEILYSQKSMTGPEYDRAIKDFKSSSARVRGAEANLVEAEQNLSYTTLRPPSDGVLLKRNIEVGSLVRPGTEGFVLADVSSVKVLFSVPDAILGDIKLGDVMEVTTQSLEDKIFTGRVTSIAPSASSRTRVFDVEITIPNNQGLLKPGMIASLSVKSTGSVQESYTVPLGSIVRSANTVEGYAVFTIVENGGKTTARLKDVVLGNIIGSRIVVLEGLQSGDLVVTMGAQLIRDGQEVSVIK